MGKNCVLVINLMVRDYFWGITELNQEKMAVAETLYPQNWEAHIENLRPYKNGFQVKFQSQKHGTHTPVRKHGKYPPGVFQSGQNKLMWIETKTERRRMVWNSGPVHMIPGQLIAPGQLTDPRVNFASVHGLTPATVHMSFSLPRGNFERQVTRCTTPGNPPCRSNFSPCEQNAKVAPGQE